jgi:hypothetical protein
MRSLFFTIFLVLLAGCATKPDPIDRLVADYAATHGLWANGVSPILDLPQTASQEQVIKRALEMHGFGGDQVASCKILKIRHIYIPPSYPSDTGLFAALVQVKAGEKIVLFRYEGKDWWSRICDVKPSA